MSKVKMLVCSVVLASSLLAGSAVAGETQGLPQSPPVPGETQTPPAPKSVKALHARQQSNEAVQLSLLDLIAMLLSNMGMSL